MKKSITDFEIGDFVKLPNREPGIINKIEGETITYITNLGKSIQGHYTIVSKAK